MRFHSRNRMLNRFSPNKSNRYYTHKSTEQNSILVSNSEDDIELDASEIELEKIATKYARKYHAVRVRRYAFFISILVMVFALVTFTVVKLQIHASSSTNAKNKMPLHHAYKRIKSKFLPGYQGSMHYYKHIHTDAEFIGYTPLDKTQDKAFGISFRTKPRNNNGVAHILEHSVLSGSKKYPAKDPFLHLMKGSLQTFLNAMTYNDRTVYPIASRNSKDFRNLMSVYLDAVFNPHCVEESGEWILKQEGWRYDVVDGDDENMSNSDQENMNSNSQQQDDKNTTIIEEVPRKELELKGVVYSEMKGVFSNPESLLYRHTSKLLFPDNTYHYDSGGEPKYIATLSHAEFVDFYNKHYHPTNSKIFISGTVDDIESAMELIHSSYLSNYEKDEKIKKNSEISFQKKKFSHHLYQSRPYSVTEITHDEGQHMLSITWLLNDDSMRSMLELSFFVLDHLLIGTSSSPLNKELMDSGLGSSVIGYGLDTGLLQSTFAVGMKGVKASEIDDLEDLIFDVLKGVVRNGFEEDDIKAAMNSIEFQLREVQTGSTPAGINIFLQLLEKWNYDIDPYSALEYEDALNNLKKTINKEGSSYFVSLVEKYLLHNTHRVHMELSPSSTLEQDTIDEEKKTMKAQLDTMSDSEYIDVIKQAENLKEIQNTEDPPEVIDTVPMLSIEDIDRNGVEYPVEIIEDAYDTGATLVSQSVDGSPGIIYIDLGVDISTISYADIGLLPFVTTILTESNTTIHSRTDLDRLIGIYTGGVKVDLELIPVHDPSEENIFASENTKMRSILFLRGKCTVENAVTMLSLMKEIIEKTEVLSQEKAIQLLERDIEDLKSDISSGGHSYSVRKMHSRYDVKSFLNEKLFGVKQLITLENLLKNAKNNWSGLQKRLSNMLDINSTLRPSRTIINLTGDRETLVSVFLEVEDFIRSLNQDGDVVNLPDFSRVDHPWMAPAKHQMVNLAPIQDEGIAISSQVSYVGKGGIMYEEGEKISGSSYVPLQYIKKGYLWDEVRAKNGAYGVMAALYENDGTIFMVSYRDPNLSKTLDVYDGTGEYLMKSLQEDDMITEKSITKAIIGCIGAIDTTALAPRDAGWLSFTRYLAGLSASRRQNWREEILRTKREDFTDFAQRLMNWKNTSVAIVGPESAFQSANENNNLNLQIIEAY